MESKLNLDFKLVEQARAHAARVADDTQRFIDGCTTVAVERTICRLLGIDGVDASDVPLPSVVVDHLMDKGALPQGAAFWIGNAMVETGKGPQAIAEDVAADKLELTELPVHSEADIHAAVIAAMNEPFHAQTAREALEASITAALAGEDGELSLPALEAKIRSLQERQMELFQLAVSAGPDCLDYDEEIQRVNAAKTSLMAKKAELEREGRTAAAFDRRMENITRELEQSAGAITEFDEITVRQLVSNIKVVSKNTLLICFKDGTEITQTMENTGRASA